MSTTKCSGLVGGKCIHGFTVINGQCNPLRDQWGNFASVSPECTRVEHCGDKYNMYGGKPKLEGSDG